LEDGKMIEGKMKAFGIWLVVMIGLIAMSGVVSALNAEIESVKLDGDELYVGADNTLSVERDNTFEVKVRVGALENIYNAEIEAVISGYDYSDKVSDVSDVFDMEANKSYIKKLALKLPGRMDVDQYVLRVYIRDRANVDTVATYNLKVDTVRHSVTIKNIDVDPAMEVEAGRSIRAIVNVKNYGQQDEEDVKIEFSVPELGLKALPDYVDVEADESKTSEELYLRIPVCAEAGQYTGEVKVTYKDGDEVETQTVIVNVVESPSGCEVESVTPADDEETQDEPVKPVEKKDKTIITVGAQSQDMKLGEGGAIYPITFTNAGTESKTYVVSITGADDWATVKISPLQTVTIGAGESKSIYVYVSAKETALPAEHMFTVDVKDAEGNVVKQIPMTANVLEGVVQDADSSSSVTKALEIGLIVLVIILIIVALIVIFTKKKDAEDEEAEDEISGQTYY
jgi:hypothetical protein